MSIVLNSWDDRPLGIAWKIDIVLFSSNSKRTIDPRAKNYCQTNCLNISNYDDDGDDDDGDDDGNVEEARSGIRG